MFRKLLADNNIKHKRTRPYRHRTNGKVERFNRTLQEEWAYARPYASEAERISAFPVFLRTYNHHRAHTALNGDSPADRTQPGESVQLVSPASSTSPSESCKWRWAPGPWQGLPTLSG